MAWRSYLAAQIYTLADCLHRLGEKVYFPANKSSGRQTFWSRDNPLLRQIAGRLKDGAKIVLIYIDIAKFNEVEVIYGSQACSRILRLLPGVLQEAAANFPLGPLMGIESLGGDDFILYFSLLEGNSPRVRDLWQTTRAFRDHAQELLRRKYRGVEIKLHAGFNQLALDPGQEVESRIYAAIKEAMHLAKDAPELEELELRKEFQSIMQHGRLTAVYQPLIYLPTGEVFGYEALTRGPEGSHFTSPLV